MTQPPNLRLLPPPPVPAVAPTRAGFPRWRAVGLFLALWWEWLWRSDIPLDQPFSEYRRQRQC
jgi:hypothetical protein